MPTREELDVKERADRALRGGRFREALTLYGTLLTRVQAFGPGVYDGWLEGALAAYQALGRRREAGHVLLALRRFSDAQSKFSAAESPLEWALCAAKLGQFTEAARVLSAAGHPILAAVELEAGGAPMAARGEWERALAHPRLADCRYETALVHFNFGECLLRMGDRAGAEREMALAQRQIEELADDFESRGDRERAFDCYGVLLRIGRDIGSFENVAEGYLNAIRILAADDQKFYVLQYYDDFLAYAVERGELYAAATLAREAADFSAKAGLIYDRHYLNRAARLWSQTAKQNEATGGPADLSENALHAGIDAATTLVDLTMVSRLYLELAALPLSSKKRERYRTLAARYAVGHVPTAPTTGFPEYLRRPGAYQDVWRQDLVEWELDGDPVGVLARLVVDRTDHLRFSRLALRALLLAGAPGFSIQDSAGAAELAVALGRIQVYEVLRPMEKLYEHNPSPEVRAAVMTGVGQVYCRRSFGLVRRGLEDPASRVRDEAVTALRSLRFRDGLDALVRIFRDATEDRVRIAALETIADIGSLEAGMVLLDAILYETGAVQVAAEGRLSTFSSEDLAPVLRQVLETESGYANPALRRAVAKMNAGSRHSPLAPQADH
jgi:tetratricopeptide (TPR) repeat protein